MTGRPQDAEALPTPLTPHDCDLRGMPFMPLDLVRLFDSDFFALSTGDEFKAAVTLWGRSFLQVPAGSLPCDDRVLAHLSSTGAGWSTVKDMALHGWLKCSDGRLYHPVVAEKALAAWEARLAQRERTRAARAARAEKLQSTAAKQAAPTAPASSVTSSVTERVTASKGEGEGEGQRDRDTSPDGEVSPVRSLSASNAPEPPIAGPVEAAPDARTVLFREGLARVMRLTGKPADPCRRLLGKMLKEAGDDAALLSLVLAEAEQARPADPLAWIKGSLNHRTGRSGGERQDTRALDLVRAQFEQDSANREPVE